MSRRPSQAGLAAPVRGLRKGVVADFTGWMAKKKEYSPATVSLYRSVLRAALRYWRANYEGWIRFTREEELEASKTSVIGSERKPESRHSRLPPDFANVMLKTALEIPLPADPHGCLDVLRTRALVAVLRATALRVGDVCSLTREDVENARRQGGRLEKRMKKTEEMAHCRLGPETLQVIDAYLDARADLSPWLLIQHGKGSQPRKKRSPSTYKNLRRGYGAQLSTVSAWRLVREIARLSGYDPEKYFTSPHAFRHWHAISLIDAGVNLENVQAVLGHSTPTTTRKIYAPEPNRAAIDQAEADLQALPEELRKPKAIR